VKDLRRKPEEQRERLHSKGGNKDSPKKEKPAAKKEYAKKNITDPFVEKGGVKTEERGCLS